MNDSDKIIADGEFKLEKFPGKGGWTYAVIPTKNGNTSNPFGWKNVAGYIDDYELKDHKLMPMGKGKLFLPVRSEIRKKINKKDGDYVTIKLYAVDSSVDLPKDILDVFENEPKEVLDNFLSFTLEERKAYIDWIIKR